MNQAYAHIQIAFDGRHEHIYPLLQEVQAFINQFAPQQKGHLDFKTKVIITELLTNSIKHAGNGQTIIELALYNNRLVINKADNGTPFCIKWSDGLARHPFIPQTCIKIYADHLNGLFALANSPYSLKFYTEDYYDDADGLADMTEHYGLMIICRASNLFTYEFDATAKKNIFTVEIDTI